MAFRYKQDNQTRPKPNPKLCAASVQSDSGWHFYQCHRKRHPDSDGGEWCLQHCPTREAAKRKKRDDAYREKRRGEYRREVERKQAPFLAAARRAVEWAEADPNVTPAQADCLRAAIMELAEAAGEGVSRWGVD